MIEIVRSERLRLRRFVPDDVDRLLGLYGEPAVMRYLDDEVWDRARIEQQVLPEFLAEYEKYRRYGYLAAETHSGSFVGRFALHPVIMSTSLDQLWSHAPTEESDVVSVGYRLLPDHWGFGYATEGTRALLALAFQQYGASLAVATTMAVNRGSRRVLERLGFRHTRTVHLEWEHPLPGNEHGDVVYQLRRAEFRSDRVRFPTPAH